MQFQAADSPRDVPEYAPLSFAQERLLLAEEFDPDRRLFNLSQAFALDGSLDVGALSRAIGSAVARHESLRTTVLLRGAMRGQRVASPADPRAYELPVRDVARGAPAALHEALRGEAARPFDLETGPLFRPVLWRLGAEEHVLTLSLHHVIADGWSIAVLLREIESFYAAYAEGADDESAAAGAASPTLPYARYAAWQREWLNGPEAQAQLQYWRTELAGAPALLDLKPRAANPPVRSCRGDAAPLFFAPELVSPLRALGAREKATLYVVGLASWFVLLARRTGRDDILVGTPLSNRTKRDVQRTIGLFVNPVVVRARVFGGLTFRQFLRQVRKTVVGALKHQDVPFEMVVEALRAPRDGTRNPLFQVAVQMQSEAVRLTLPGLAVRTLDVPSDSSKFDILLLLDEGARRDGSVSGWIEYRTDLFDRDTVAELANEYATILQQIADDPDMPLTALTTAIEAVPRRSLPSAPVHEDAHRPTCLHSAFEAQVNATPDAIALVHDGLEITYADLNRDADRLAAALRGLGVGPECLVGICTADGRRFVLAVLAVLKAAGGYVPLDAEHPRERLGAVAADSGIRLLLTDGGCESKVRGLPIDRIVSIDGVLAEPAPADGVRAPVHADNVAYVIYTSGSTGTPKGVVVSHDNAVHLALAQRTPFDVVPASRVLQFSSFAFDASVSEIFVTLLAGAALVTTERCGRRDPADLLHTLETSGATHVTLPPSLLATLRHADQAGPGSLSTLVAAGEALSPKIASAWLRRVPRLLNAYGPTETTVCATVSAPVQPGADIDVGAPLADVTVHVLDSAMRQVDGDTAGEVYVGGAGVARGYLGRPGHTAERFVPDPFSSRHGARVFRTGDLGRQDAIGRLRLLGRLDEQVKVRGHRVELQEIRNALLTHAPFADCAVVAHEDDVRGTELLAFVVPQSGAPLDASALRDDLSRHLPSFMVPSEFIELSTLPVTSSGKVDRRRLRAPEWRRKGEPEPAAVATPLEDLVRREWGAVLNREHLGLDEDFFELGGHSLLGMQVTWRMREILGIQVTLRSLFEAPTVRRYAALLARQGAPEQLSHPRAVASGGTR